ncbi:MAG TPA: hypothetical protein VK638_40795 [Edaphobacter sp.]|nr:hypothetical protein [Edaphobacter sp.]
MPLIEINQSRPVSATIRLESATATLIDQYATFLHAPADDVVDRALNYVFSKDREFSGVPEDRAVLGCCTHFAGSPEWEW